MTAPPLPRQRTAVRRPAFDTAPTRPDAGGTIELLSQMLAGTPRRQELFDADDQTDQDRTIEICRRCRALAECRAWVDGLPERDRPPGVTAGMVFAAPGRPRTTAKRTDDP